MARRIRKCPYCGSSRIIVDYARGTVICANCGTVLEDTIYDYSYRDIIEAASRSLQGFPRPPLERRYTVTEIESIQYKFSNLRLSIDIVRKLKENNPQYISRLYELLLHDNELLSNNCVVNIVRRLNSRLKPLAIEIVKALKRGEYPLLAYYSAEYGVSKNKVKKLLKTLSECLE